MTFAMVLLAVAGPLGGALFARRALDANAARRAGIAGALVGVLAALGLLALRASGISDPWIVPIELASDPWAAPLPLFVTLIGLVSVAMSPVSQGRPATISRILLVNAASVALVLLHHSLALALLWACTILPVWAELRSRPETRQVGRLFAIYMVPSMVLVAVGALLLERGFVLPAVLALAAGIAIREAVLPVHSWFPAFVEKAPMGLAVAFVAPQLGVLAHLRWLTHAMPHGMTEAVAVLGAVTALFAAALGVVQLRARRALGYMMMSQTALVAFGLETGNPIASAGTQATWLASGLATAGFAMAMAALEARRGALSLDRPSGSFARIPLLATAFLILGLSSVGLPGTLGFVAEDLLVQGSVEHFPVLALVLVIATALNAVTVIRAFFLLFTGSRRHVGERDLTGRERLSLSVLMVALFVAGLWPNLLTRSMSPNAGEEVPTVAVVAHAGSLSALDRH